MKLGAHFKVIPANFNLFRGTEPVLRAYAEKLIVPGDMRNYRVHGRKGKAPVKPMRLYGSFR